MALLRGINVGGRNLLPMSDLAGLCTDAGCAEARTYIQSGNVLFKATPAKAAGVAARIARGIEERYGFRAPVLLRSVEELGEVIRNNPFLAAGAPENTLHVLFLEERPDDLRVSSLDPDRSPPDTFSVRGREVYLHLPNGAGTTRLTNAWFDTRLATIGTGRNWRTVNKLFELASG